MVQTLGMQEIRQRPGLQFPRGQENLFRLSNYSVVLLGVGTVGFDYAEHALYPIC